MRSEKMIEIIIGYVLGLITGYYINITHVIDTIAKSFKKK